MRTTRRRRAAIGAVVVSLLAVGGSFSAALAGSPSSVTVSVGHPAHYSGGPLTGSADPLGPPAPECAPNMCDHESVHLSLPGRGYAATHIVTLSVRLAYSPSGPGNCLDVAILDTSGNALASQICPAVGHDVSAGDVPAGSYVVEVDADGTVGGTVPQSFTATVSATAVPRVHQQAFARGGLGFSRESVVDPFRLGTEPTVVTAPGGAVYESPIFGSSTTQSFVERSLDGGQTFATLGLPGVGKLDACQGGGDSALSTDRYPGDLYMVDLATGPEVPVRVTNNRGQTFASACEAQDGNGADYFPDRPWLTTDLNHTRLWYIYRDGLLNPGTGLSAGGFDVDRQTYGEYLKYSPLPGGRGRRGPRRRSSPACAPKRASTPRASPTSPSPAPRSPTTAPRAAARGTPTWRCRPHSGWAWP